MVVLPKPSEVNPPQNAYDVYTEERLYTRTEVRLELNRQTKELKDQNSYLLNVVAELEKKLANQKT